MDEKVFIDKKCGQIYIKNNLGFFIKAENLDADYLKCLKEVSYKSVVANTYHLAHYEHKDCGIDGIMSTKFSLKDILSVPLSDGRVINFRVEHIGNGKVYFVSKDIVGKCSIKNMQSFLADFEAKMPIELTKYFAMIHQKTSDGQIDRKSTLFIPSMGNVRKTDDYCCGLDDIQFDGFKTEADRCANYEGETHWWWTSTPYERDVVSAADFASVYYYGACDYNYASHALGVRPAFGVSIVDEDSWKGI